MTGDEVVAALELPPAARVDRRVPKALLVERGAATARDRRNLNEGIEQVIWVAALKPVTIGVAAYRDDLREYSEIAVLRADLRDGAMLPRLTGLLHRAIPYPVVAVTAQRESVTLSVAHKRWSRSEAGKTVLDGEAVAEVAPDEGDSIATAFAEALALGRQPRSTLYALYQGWLDALLALAAARRTGVYTVLPNAERCAARRVALGECVRLDSEIVRLRAAAKKEMQMARKVELNLQLKRIEAAYAEALERLG